VIVNDLTKKSVLVKCDSDCNLIIDLTKYFGYQCVVTITAWHRGISWTGITTSEDQAIPTFKELGVPFSVICAEEAAAPWLRTFPSGLAQRLIAYELKYQSTLYSLLWCISRTEHALELFDECQVLVWLILKTANFKQLDTDYTLEIFARKRPEILQACGLYGSRASLKLIYKLRFSYWSQYEYKLIIGFDWSSASRILNHLPYLDEPLLILLKRYPGFVRSRIIQTFGHVWCWDEFDLYFDDTLTMAADLGVADIFDKIFVLKNVSSFKKLHDKLVVQLNEQKCRDEPLIYYVEPPIIGNDLIIPITNNHDLNIEGAVQHHCIASYHKKIYLGEYYVYKILEPERATLGLKLKNGCFQSVDQIKLCCNDIVSKETLALVDEWLSLSKGGG